MQQKQERAQERWTRLELAGSGNRVYLWCTRLVCTTASKRCGRDIEVDADIERTTTTTKSSKEIAAA